eukprot:s968_g15.t2
MARATLVSLYAPCQAFTDHMSLPIAWDIKVTCTRLVQCQSKLAIEKNLSYRHHLLSISDLLEQIQFTTAIIRLDQINKRRRRHYLTWEETAISTHANDAVRSVTEKSLLHWLNLDVEEIKKLIDPAKAARSQFQCHLNYFKQLRQVIARHSFLSEQSAGLLLLVMALARSWEISLADISTAFLHASIEEPVFVWPPSEYYPQANGLWTLNRAMYGLRQSPKRWQDHFPTVMEKLGFRRCKSDSNLYCHKSRSLYVLAYVDDLLIVGDAKLKKEFIDALGKELLVKITGELKPNTEHSFLGRKLRHNGDSIDIFMPKQYADFLGLYSMNNVNSVNTTGSSSLKRIEDADVALDAKAHSLFRTAVGKLLWLAFVRPDCSYAVKELSRDVKGPTVESLAKLKRLLSSEDVRAVVFPTTGKWVRSFEGQRVWPALWMAFLSDRKEVISYGRAPDVALKIGAWSCFCFCGGPSHDLGADDVLGYERSPSDVELVVERAVTPNDDECEDDDRPNFSGDWMMVKAEGDMDAFLKEMGVGYVSKITKRMQL